MPAGDEFPRDLIGEGEAPELIVDDPGVDAAIRQ